MKFVDETSITVQAGKAAMAASASGARNTLPEAARTAATRRRRQCLSAGGPRPQHPSDFRFQRHHRAENGESGRGRNCAGKAGKDLEIRVPVGTAVLDEDSGEMLGDLSEPDQRLKVAQGGFHGLGNTRFKSSTNRAPRQTTTGTEGEMRSLRLELNVLADVGLLGLPNAGKSTLIRAISAAKPRVADYPFTTLVPNLGVVKVEAHRSFVVADIPGLIEGASQGAGLGIRFLRHLTRNRILLHLVDVMPADGGDPAESALSIVRELERFSPALARLERWLVLSKTDLVDAGQLADIRQSVVNALEWDGPVYEVSAVSGAGTTELVGDIMTALEQWQEDESADPQAAEAERQRQLALQAEARQRIGELRGPEKPGQEQSEQEEDDKHHVEVEHVH